MALLAALLGLGLAACDDSTSPAPTGEVRGIVMVEGTGLSGVTVELSGETTRETVTDESGRFGFDEVSPGAYVVSIRGQPSDASFSSTSRTAVIARESGGRTVTLDFLGSYIRTSSIRGAVNSRDRGLAGVTVRLEGRDTAIATTDSQGRYSFAGLRRGSYEVEISGYPANVSFSVTRTEVLVETGETANISFDGDPELTASVVISSLRRQLQDGGTVSVDAHDLRGVVEVELTVDRGDDTPESVELLLGDEVVGRQDFNPDGSPLAVSESGDTPPVGQWEEAPDGSSFSLTFTVATDEFSQITGQPRFMNGERTLRARLSTREGGPAVWTSTVPVYLNNRDTFVGRVDAQKGPVAGPEGEEWIGGTLTLLVSPIIYNEGRQVESLTVEIRRSGGAPLRTRMVEGGGPFQLSFSGSGDPTDGNVVGYQTPRGATDEFRVREARYTDGGSVPGMPISLSDGWRIDNAPPPDAEFRLPRQGDQASCCLGNWIGADFWFSEAFVPGQDAGVGGGGVSFHVGGAELTNTELAATPEVEVGGDVDPSATNSTYAAVAVQTDALDNRTITRLQPSPGNTLSNESGGIFGVDTVGPDLRFTADAVPAWAVNPPDGSRWALRAEDRESGFGSSPARVTLRRVVPGLDGQAACPFPGTEDCAPAPDALSRDVPLSGSGYFRYQARVLDRAGNPSVQLTRWILRDEQPPQVEGVVAPSQVQGGESLSVEAPVQDDVDLHRADLAFSYGGSEPGAGVAIALAPADRMGTPFDGSPIATATARWSVPGIPLLETTLASGAPSGILLDVEAAEVTVHDAAGHMARAQAELGPAQGVSGRSFSEAERGQEGGIQRWNAGSQESTVCAESRFEAEEPCPPHLRSVSLEASAFGEGGALESPFQEVHFLAILSDGVRWLGMVDGGGGLQVDDVGQEGREWRWTLDWEPEAGFPAGSYPVVVLGLDEDGNALLSGESSPVTVTGG